MPDCPPAAFTTNDGWAIVRGVAGAEAFPLLLMNHYSAGTLYMQTVRENPSDLYALATACSRRSGLPRRRYARLDKSPRPNLFVRLRQRRFRCAVLSRRIDPGHAACGWPRVAGFADRRNAEHPSDRREHRLRQRRSGCPKCRASSSFRHTPMLRFASFGDENVSAQQNRLPSCF